MERVRERKTETKTETDRDRGRERLKNTERDIESIRVRLWSSLVGWENQNTI